MNLVLNYAAIGFRPYYEIGEYVNVGVVAVEAKSRFLSYKLLSPQKTKRISVCFPKMDLGVYRIGIKRLENELSALAIETNLWADDSKQAGKNHPAQSDLFVERGDNQFFKSLVSSPASPFFYASRGTRITDDIETALDELYGHYVEHWNLTPVDYEEKKLVRDIRRLFSKHSFGKLYKESPWVGTEAYHVGIPLTFTESGRDVPSKAIKPLNLAQSTPTRIYTHGDEWIAKVKRLKTVDSLPGSFLFVVKRPDDSDGRKAAQEICEGLIAEGVEVADVSDDEAILAFARLEENPELELKA